MLQEKRCIKKLLCITGLKPCQLNVIYLCTVRNNPGEIWCLYANYADNLSFLLSLDVVYVRSRFKLGLLNYSKMKNNN